MTPARLAELHARAFTVPPPWTADGFAATLETAFLLTEGSAFLVGRTAGPETELLTLAVPPEQRRQGLGRVLLDRFERRSAGTTGFLEVAEDNAAARALYHRAGWSEVGRRPGYFAGIDGLVLRKLLS